VLIVYVLLSRRGLGLSKHNRNVVNITPDYNSLHWCPRHINAMHFTKLDSYDICGLSAVIYRTVLHHRIRYILGVTGAGYSRLSSHEDQQFCSWDYVFIKNNESVRTWLLSNQVLNNLYEIMVYCYRDQRDRLQNTPQLTRVKYLAEVDMCHWPHDPVAHTGHMHIRSARDLAYSERGECSDGDAVNDQDTSHISETSSNSTDSRYSRQFLSSPFLSRDSVSESSLHVSEYETAGDNISDILPLSEGILARSIVNQVPRGIKRLSQLNTQPVLDLNGHPSQGDKILKCSAPNCGKPCNENSPKRRCTTYFFHVSHLANKGRKRPAEQDVVIREDNVSKRKRRELVSQIQSFDCGISAEASEV